jgi:Mrp family chromosome partitioning ATPase
VGADASVAAKWVDGVVLVIDMDEATDRSVRNALRQLEAVQASLIGVLLNRDHAIEDSAYGYYGETPERISEDARRPARAGAFSDNGAGAGGTARNGRRFGRRRQRSRA